MEKNFDILGVRIDKTDYENLVDEISHRIEAREKMFIVTPNPEIVLKASENEQYRDILNNADVRIADGIGLSLAAWYQYQLKGNETKLAKIFLWGGGLVRILVNKQSIESFLPQVSGDVLVNKIIEKAGLRKWKIFILGGKKGNAKALERKLTKQGLQVMSDEGSERVDRETEAEKESIITKINDFGPDVLLVAYGAPWQEKWIRANWKKLKTYIAIGIGGTVDDLANGKQTPDFLRKRGLRWFWRLVNEPKRIRRIWRAVVVFGGKVISSQLFAGKDELLRR